MLSRYTQAFLIWPASSTAQRLFSFQDEACFDTLNTEFQKKYFSKFEMVDPLGVDVIVFLAAADMAYIRLIA